MITHINSTRVIAPESTVPKVKACPRWIDEEDSALNPSRKEVSDWNSKRVFNCKNYPLIGTFNAVTLRENHMEKTTTVMNLQITSLGVISVSSG